MNRFTQNTFFGFLLATVLLFSVPSPEARAESTLKLELFKALPPRPTMMDIRGRAGTPLNSNPGQPGMTLHSYRLSDGTTVLVGASPDGREVYFISHEVKGISTKIYPKNP